MSYYEVLSDYTYAPGFVRFGTKSVGWLARGHVFPTMIPDEQTLDLLWLYCSISVVQTRGVHDCEFCSIGSARYFERNGQRLSLGTSEIRVFSRAGQVYAAPTLIYHYVADHHYKPPDEFLKALREGPRPPNQEYFDWLAALHLEWSKTSKGAPKNRVLLHPDAGLESKNYLTKIGTLSDIERLHIKLEEGLTMQFYRPEDEGENNLFFDGTIHFDSKKNLWYALIDEKSYRHESDGHVDLESTSSTTANRPQ